ncbi:B12-binding domain-containing radical SAM protein [Candidatus Woesearchaeota archaeon]|nr:B12-binding domain-containing radical SAM protein [Candidatus Woesearchaeota archaeon]
MKITLIYPKVGKGKAAPLSLLSLASQVDAEIIDERLGPVQTDANLIGITANTGEQLKNAVQIAKNLRKRECKIIWGGNHATILPEQVLRSGLADFVIRGEGEIPLKELLAGNIVNGVCYLKDSKFIENGFGQCGPLKIFDYDNRIGIYDYSYLEFSRGCPFSCSHCLNSVHFKKYRTHDPVEYSAFIRRTAQKHKIKRFWFVDDNFFATPKALELLGLLKDADLEFEIPGVHIECIKDYGVELSDLREAGVKTMYIGVESGSERILRMLNKNLKLDDLFSVNRKLTGFNVVYNFMAGFPGETDEDFTATINVIKRLLSENPEASVSPLYAYTPYPGTALYDRSIKAGFIPPDSLEGWANFNWSNIRLPWVSAKRKKQIEDMYKWALFLGKKPSHVIRNGFARAGLVLMMPVLRPIAWRKCQ